MDELEPPRIRPVLTALNRPFWTSGADGVLRVLRCADCRTWIHPPSPICPSCRSLDVGPEPVSGEGVVASFTVNHQPWTPGLRVPYVVAIVELPEQPALRLTTNVVGCAPDEVHVGQRVTVRFEADGEIHVPVFAPVGAAS